MRRIFDADKMWDQVELCVTHNPQLQMHAAVRDHRFWSGLTLFVHTLYIQQTLLKGSPHHQKSCTVLYSWPLKLSCGSGRLLLYSLAGVDENSILFTIRTTTYRKLVHQSCH